MIEFKNVSKHFGPTQVLHNIDLNIAQGEVVVIIGPSGSGKSTLLRCINKLEEITSGDLIVDGLKVNDPKVDERLIRQEAGMVFQQFYLFPHLTALENVMFGPLRVRGANKEEAEKLARELLAKVGLAERAHHYPSELSGGQQQRVAIARALAVKPKMMLFDEPTSALDISVQAQILNLLVTLQENHGLTYVLISHNVSVIRHMSDRVAVMYLGQIVELGDAQQVLTAPAHPYTRLLLDSLPAIDKPLEEEWALRKTDLPGNRTLPQGCFFYERCPLATHGCEVRQSLAIREDGRELRCWRAL